MKKQDSAFSPSELINTGLKADIDMKEETEVDPISHSVIGTTKSVLYVPQPDETIETKI